MTSPPPELTGLLTTTRRSLRRSTDGAVAIAFALMAPTLVLTAGLAIDLARISQARAVLQNLVDSAALKGSTAFSPKTDAQCSTSSDPNASAAVNAAQNFINAASQQLSTSYGVAVQAPVIVANYEEPVCGQSGLNGNSNVTITVTAQIQHSLTATFMGSFAISATATAVNPNTEFSVLVSSASHGSQTEDIDSFGYYQATGLAGLPNAQDITWFWSNSQVGGKVSTNESGVTIPYTATYLIGFTLANVTGGRSAYQIGSDPAYSATPRNYPVNAYGSVAGTAHYFYSTQSPPNAAPVGGYPIALVPTNNSLQAAVFTSPVADTSNQQALTARVAQNWVNAASTWTWVQQGVTSNPSLSSFTTISCAALGAYPNTLLLAWNDMGDDGGGDQGQPQDIAKTDNLRYDAIYGAVFCKNMGLGNETRTSPVIPHLVR